MAASLSEEEFQRMQMQLLELRTKNYTLGEKNVKIQTEFLENNKLLEDLKKELAKCQKVISRSKNAKEIEQFIQENDALQQKLQMQEDEFRLQNQTLMQEISHLVVDNERLTKELDLIKSNRLTTSEFQRQDDIIKLEAENVALKKLISNFENKTEDSSLNITDKDKLELKLNTLAEEKSLFKKNMEKMEAEFKKQLLEMQAENDKLLEKLKKKQESFLKLQEEKETLYNENKLAIELLQSSKDKEILELKEQMQNLQSDLKDALDFNEKIAASGEEVDNEAVVELSFDKATFDCSVSETRLSLINIQNKIHTLNSELVQAKSIIENTNSVNEELQSQIKNLEAKNIELEEALAEKSKLAENRKQLMDTMKNHLLETTNKHSSEIENLTRQLADEQDKLQKLFDKEKETESKLLESRNEVQTLKDELERLRTDYTSSDSNVKDLEKQLQENMEEFESKIIEKEAENVLAVEKVKEEMGSVIKDLTIQLEVLKAEKAEFEDKVKVLQQEAKDSIDERKIQEKKGVSMVKDLKRQLQVERNRAEKLQERLQEILSDQNRSIDDILPAANNAYEKNKGDTGSISSWSYVSGGTADRENKDVTLHSDTSSGGHESPNRVSPTILETETNSLIAKVAELQQKNSTLTEKVSHLEISNEALVDDVLKKTAIIQYYCMEGRADLHASSSQDKLTIKRIVDFIKDRGDENLKEINRRMQRLLEETLTKNMHLQNDIEILSTEVSRLSKLATPPTENGLLRNAT